MTDEKDKYFDQKKLLGKRKYKWEDPIKVGLKKLGLGM